MARIPDQEEAGLEQSVPSNQSAAAAQGTSTSSLSVELLRLPQHYFNALVEPSVRTFTQDKGTASWGLVWTQLLVWAVLDAALGVLVNIISPPAVGPLYLRYFAIATSYGLVVVVPMLFFLLMGIVHLLAKYLGGQGTFLELCNASLYVQAPLGILSKLLALIPGVGRILNTVLSLYGVALMVFPIMATHRLGRGKAIASILTPLVAIGVFAGVYFLLMRK